jgi:N-acetylneuraminic acid mutarotase
MFERDRTRKALPLTGSVRVTVVTQAVFLALLASCSDDAATTVQLTLRYEAAWDLDTVEIKMREKTAQCPITRDVELLVADDWAGSAIELELWALRGHSRYAHGSVTVTPIAKAAVQAEVPLTRLPCGAWCTVGAMQCEGEAVVVCEQRNDDPCLEWSDPVPCSPAAPYCSFGVCDVTCIDECADGEARCDGPTTWRQCGRPGGRPCLQWLPAVACAAGESCANGRCAVGCTDECAAGASECRAGGVIMCDDFNHDGCREWGPVHPCAPSQSCSNGVCVDGCIDECRGPVCENLVFRQCGHYDLSGCLKLSAGTSCVAANDCAMGSCTTAPRACTTPPESECVDDHTLRAYDATGSCQTGGCRYAVHDRECPNCPNCDACAGVSCTSPPTSCWHATGTCTNGSCRYEPDDRAECTDGDACTDGDHCEGGTCTGARRSCTTPPQPECLTDARTRRTYGSPGTCGDGECAYPSTDERCPAACHNGVCVGNTCGSGWCPLPATADTPSARESHVAVWTGTEMIVWGGDAGLSLLQDGGRFNPATNTWRTLPTLSAPPGNTYKTAVWTGTEMIVWGDDANGSRFNPTTDTWTLLPNDGAPSERIDHTAVWTGAEMIVWGGRTPGSSDVHHLQDGGRFNPTTNTWRALPTMGAPVGRDEHAAVWTGTEMIVWGGNGASNGSAQFFRDGGRFDPTTNTWRALPTMGAPVERDQHTAVWTGTEMIVWGGWGSEYLSDGGRFNPTTDTWTALPNYGAPRGRIRHTAVWTGAEMIVWGGDDGHFLPDGSGRRFDPSTGTWTPLSAVGEPSSRGRHTAIWTGAELIVWGGWGVISETSWGVLQDGGRWMP